MPRPEPQDLEAALAATAALETRYGLQAQLSPLPGEHDLNFLAATGDGTRYLFKVHAGRLPLAEVECQAAVLEHLAEIDSSIGVPRLVRDRAGRALSPIVFEGAARWCRLTTWLEGTLWADSSAPGGDTRISLGAFLGRLDRALSAFSHPGAERTYAWDLARAGGHLEYAHLISGHERQRAVRQALERFANDVAPRLSRCPIQVIHNDANDRNVLLDRDGRVSGLLDFGDMVRSHRVIEVAVAAAYAAIGATDPLRATADVVGGYCGECQLSEAEAELVLDLMMTRYAISMVMAAKQSREQPGNAYLLVSQDAIWPELKRLGEAIEPLARLRVRSAAGWPAAPNSRHILHWLELAERPAPILETPATANGFTVLEFDRQAVAKLAGTTGGRDPAYADWVARELAKTAGRMAVAPYGEDRAIERHSGARDIHLGINVFASPGTEVRAPFDAVVEARGNDASPFGFGGALLLRHETDIGAPFWTFFGHLDPGSGTTLDKGVAVGKGQAIGRLAASDRNGGWPSHLHVQLWSVLLHDDIAAMPGLAARADWEVWQSICPDPNLVLGLPVNTAKVVARDAEWLRAERRRRMGRVFSLAYAAPLKIVGGLGCRLFDEDGNAYLDLVNNVCHVGHCHPRVVAAATTQMARLNTNTRYLHDNVVEYARRLTQTMPAELSVCFFVNSGSEANDLALRIARAHAGAHEVIALDHAYHGHLSSLIDVSPYKFAGPGGEGRPAHVHVAEMPDLYRGRWRREDPDAGARYAASVGAIVQELALGGRRPAAFFCESILGCGGQLVLPDGYLKEAYAHVRAAGGIVIADEVQVGFGRTGSHMWAFEAQGVVPDIVTLGKPIGNGHPMGAVVTRPEIAASFATGMEYFNTFGGNPVSAAIGLAVLDVIRDERLMRNAREMGEILCQGFLELAGKHSLIGDVRGLGLFMGVEFVKDRGTREPAPRELARFVELLKVKRILTSSEGPRHNVLKIKPPLVIGRDDCERFLVEARDCLAEI